MKDAEKEAREKFFRALKDEISCATALTMFASFTQCRFLETISTTTTKRRRQ